MKDKKIAIIILCVLSIALISLGIFSILVENKTVTKKEYKELKWNSYYGNEIPSEYEIYKEDNLKIYNFNLDTKENNTNFDIKLPKDLIVNELNSGSIAYVDKHNNHISYVITETYAENLIKELEVVKENNDPYYEKIYIESTKYDEDIFAIIVEHARYNNDKTTMMFDQDIRIYVKANESNQYVIINLLLTEQRIDKDLLSNIINSITIKKDTTQMCEKNKCEVDFNKFDDSLNKKITLTVNKDKYVFQYNEGISGLKSNFITKEYYEASEENIDKLTTIDIEIVYNNDYYLDNLPYQEEIEVDGIKLIGSYVEKDLEYLKQYQGTYIYSTKDKFLVIITIDSRCDNVEDVLKDFIKFKLQ